MIEQNLKIELIHDGGVQHEGYQALGFYAMPLLHKWPAPRLDERGEYRWSAYDKAGSLLASRGYSPLFAEWQSTLKPTDLESNHKFRECIIIPGTPEAQVVIERRSVLQGWRKIAVINVPKDTDQVFLPRGVQVRNLHEGGAPEQCLNIVFISEGYGYKDQDLFWEDATRASALLLEAAPYSEHKALINTTAILKPIRIPGIPLAEKDDATMTNFDTTYGALGMDRYMAVRDPHALFESIGNVPCDVPVVLCNSEKYGGCGLYHQYCALPARIDPPVFEYLLLHEFAHAFAGVGDEYFDSTVTYTAEWLRDNPAWEPNVSTLENGKVKWQHRIAPDTPVPTPWRKDEYVALAEKARGAGTYVDPDSAAKAQLADFLKAEPHYGRIGAFEGARYTATGLYRPEVDCRMFSKTAKHFCTICSETISNAIRETSGQGV